MEKYLYPAFLIISIAAMVWYLYKTHTKWLANIAVRAVAGTILILVCNAVLSLLKINCMVGINWVSVVTIALLGVPGFILLYGSAFFFPHL